MVVQPRQHAVNPAGDGSDAPNPALFLALFIASAAAAPQPAETVLLGCSPWGAAHGRRFSAGGFQMVKLGIVTVGCEQHRAIEPNLWTFGSRV